MNLRSKIAFSTGLLGFLYSLAISQINPHHAPLYWSVYEHHIVKEQNGVQDNYISEAELMANIDWVDQQLKVYGYHMICMDGWGDASQLNDNGYRTSHSRHWEHDYAWWSDHLQSRGMKLGMYDNPLWIHVNQTDTSTKIVNTTIPVSSLINPSENALWFKWVQVNRPGAEEYVKGYIRHYADMGIRYLRVDFLSWFESGYDRNMGTVGPERPREDYVTALRWMREACDANGMFLSLVMPNLFNDAKEEKKYGHMIRISEDTGYGEWWKFSEKDRGMRYPTWSQYANAFDGFIYWSKVSGRDSVRLDGDFIRINTFKTAAEKRSVIAANVLAGGPVTISDQHHTIGNDLWAYTNTEILALRADRFVGKPLTNDPTDESSQVWTGQLSNGDRVVGFFNRESTPRIRSIRFSDLGIPGDANVRDLWQQTGLGSMNAISVPLAPHDCIVLRLSSGTTACTGQTITFPPIPGKQHTAPDFTPEIIASSGLPVTFEVTSGPATVVNNRIHLTGQNGTVYVTARQNGTEGICGAIPQVQSFEVSGGHQPQLFIGATFTNWSLSISMSLVNGTWMAEGVEIPPGNQELKFANTNNWSGDDWGNATGLSGTAQLATGGAPNIRFTSPGGIFTIYFNDITLEYSIESVLSSANLVKEFRELRIYPNPAGTDLFIRSGESLQWVIITDVTGRMLWNGPANSSEVRLGVSHFPAGMYVVNVVGKERSWQEKVIIQR